MLSEKTQEKSVMVSHSQTFAGLSFKSIWTDFENNPSQNTITLIPLPTHPPLRENWRLLKNFSFFFWFGFCFLVVFCFVFDTFYLCSKYLHLSMKGRGQGYIIPAALYNITRTKICSVKFIIRSKTILITNYLLCKWEACWVQNAKHCQPLKEHHSIILQISRTHMFWFFFYGSFIYSIATLTDSMTF